MSQLEAICATARKLQLQKLMKHLLPELPFSKSALEPHISAETLDFHHDKHQRAYVDKLNSLISGTKYAEMALEEIITHSNGPVFENAAQVWNHNFYWQSLIPGGKEPQGELLGAIQRDFGSLQALKEKFTHAAAGQFGSGWAWLVRLQGGKLAVETTPNAENPLAAGKTALLTCDVWEHAYYIDYRNDRPKFLEASFQLLNWEFAARNYLARTKLAA